MTYYSEHRKHCLQKSNERYHSIPKTEEYKAQKAEYHRQWREKNRESWLAKKKIYRQNNKPKLDAYWKAYKDKHNPADTSMKPVSIKRLGCVNAGWVWNKDHTEKLIVKYNIYRRKFTYITLPTTLK